MLRAALLFVVVCIDFDFCLFLFFWSIRFRMNLNSSLFMRIVKCVYALFFTHNFLAVWFDRLLSILLICRYMDSAGGLSLYPSHRCKTIHLVCSEMFFSLAFFFWCAFEVSDLFFMDLKLLLVHIVEFMVFCLIFKDLKFIWNLQVRHAQGVHNVAMEIDHSLLKSYDYFDAQLSTLGWQQVHECSLIAIISNVIHTEGSHLHREER